MTNIGHYRAAAKVLEGVKNLKAKLWICPPTKMDEETLKAEGYYKIFENCGARLELPGCSLCMGNQARVCLLYTSPSPRDVHLSRMPSSA